MPKPFSRRSFTKSAVAVIATTAVLGEATYLLTRTPPTSNSYVLPDVLFADTESAEQIGRIYLENHPEDGNGIESLKDKLNHYRKNAKSDFTTFKHHIDQAIRDDFKHKRIVRLDDWTLSITECRLCAWYCVAHKQG